MDILNSTSDDPAVGRNKQTQMTTVPKAKNGMRRRLSRYGCRNCKLRKLKCDEAKPHCARCRAYGVVCNFESHVPDLQPLSQDRRIIESTTQSLITRTYPPQRPVSNAIWSWSESSFFNLDCKDQDLFNNFRNRTIHSLGGPSLVMVYENSILRDAFTCPALMYGIRAMAAAHNDYLTLSPTIHHSLSRGLSHSSACTALFSTWLSQPVVVEEQKDTIWATAVTLANLAFANVNITTSMYDAWPLKAPDPSDLQWLRLKINDKAIWHIANPMRPNSAFRAMSEMFYANEPPPDIGISGISEELAILCGLDGLSTVSNNPYFAFTHMITRLLNAPRGTNTLMEVFTALSAISPELYLLLEGKDATALLLIYLWYTRAQDIRWWVDVRARHELPAIRAYLQLYHGEIDPIKSLIHSTQSDFVLPFSRKNNFCGIGGQETM